MYPLHRAKSEVSLTSCIAGLNNVVIVLVAAFVILCILASPTLWASSSPPLTIAVDIPFLCI